MKILLMMIKMLLIKINMLLLKKDKNAATDKEKEKDASASHDIYPDQAQRELLRISSLATKPSDGDMATILKPLADLIGEIQVHGDSNLK